MSKQNRFKSEATDGTKTITPPVYVPPRHVPSSTPEGKCYCIGGDRKEHDKGKGQCAFNYQRSPSMFEEIHSNLKPYCYCIGLCNKKHRQGDTGCIHMHTGKASPPPMVQQGIGAQMLPAPVKATAPEISDKKISEQTSMFKGEAEKPPFNFKVTREHEILTQSINAAIRNHPKDWMQVLDNDHMTFTMSNNVITELHLMGYNCIEEDPFGAC